MGRAPSRVCFRCGKHGHFLSECRAVLPTRFPDPYTGAQAATYLDEDYTDFGSGPPPSQATPAPPDPYGPPVPSESSWSSFSEQATLAQFAPPGKSRVPNESVVGDITVPGSYLHSAFVVQSGSNENDVWIADSGASCHMTHDGTRMYNARPPPPGRETITIGDRRRISVEYVGNMDVIFHGKSDQRITLIDVAYVPDLGFNLYETRCTLLGEVQFLGKTSRPACRIDTPLAAAALIPGPLKHGKEVDINHLHVSLAHAHASVLKATAKQHGIRLTGELVSCSACSRAKGHRAPTPHHATRRATHPLGLVHIDTAEPYPTSLGGSRYVVMFVDSASRLQRPYGVREKSAAAILSVVKRFVADMGVPRAFRTENGTEYSNSMFMDFCNGLGIRREFTAPYTP